MVNTAMRAFGRIEILVNSAAIFSRTPFLTVTEEDWDRFLGVNLKAPFLLCRLVGEVMSRQGRGVIVNLADIAGAKVWAEYIPYSVSKAGLLALTTGLAKRWHRCPSQCHCAGTVAPAGRQRCRGTGARVGRVPLRRLGLPEDITRAALYLIESDFVTGEVLTVDGGHDCSEADALT